MPVRFGTDGWRAVIGEGFTFSNVRRVSAAIARAMASPSGSIEDPPVVVGFDTRFLSRRFAEAAAETLMGAGRRVILSDAPCPTPASSCQVVASGSPFGVVITASHNPSEFNGVKIKESAGSSARPEITAACERSLKDEDPARMTLEEGRKRGMLSEVSFHPAHRDRLARMVDLESIQAAGYRVVADPMHGSCGPLLETLLSGNAKEGGGRTRATTIHACPDPLFGGMHPEPLEQNLQELREAVVASKADVGLAVDGDGDRVGAFDEKGQFVSPLRIAPLLAWNLIRKGRRGPLAKTFANTLLLDRIAEKHDLPFSVFPVGFKYIASEMQAGRLLLGGEESGGIGVEGFIPERDGTLVSLMLLQAMRDEGKPLSGMVAELMKEFGELHYQRRDIPCAPEQGRRLVERLKTRPPLEIGGMRVTGADDLDGLKLLFGGEGWILFRASGTEPVLRVYSEAPTRERLEAVMREALSLIA